MAEPPPGKSLPVPRSCPICAHGTNLLTHIDTPVFIVAPDGSFQFINDACLRLIGSPSPEQSLKFNAFKLPPMRAAGVVEVLKRCLEGELIEEEVDYISMWGKPARVRLEAVPLKNADGEVLAAACVLEQHERAQEQEGRIKRLTSELKRVREDLRELDQLRNRIIAKVSHELRTPLLPLHGYLKLLDDGAFGDLNAKQDKAIRVARRNARRLIDLVEQTLQVTHERELSRPVKNARIEPAVMARDAVDAIQPALAGRKIQVEVDVAPGLPQLRGDRSKLTRVIMTLLDNAQKYAGDAGRIGVSARADDEGHVILDVANSGVAIPADERERVFQPFYQVDEDEAAASGGIGLGLAIARDVVEAHGGEIRVAESDDYATTLRVTLPVSGESPGHPDSPLAALRVFLLDKQPERLDGLLPVLEDAGYDVRAAPLDAQLEDRLHAWPPDAVILGVGESAELTPLPYLRGAARTRHIPVMLVITGDDDSLADQSVDAGATAVVPLAEAATQLLVLLEAVDKSA